MFWHQKEWHWIWYQCILATKMPPTIKMIRRSRWVPLIFVVLMSVHQVDMLSLWFSHGEKCLLSYLHSAWAELRLNSSATNRSTVLITPPTGARGQYANISPVFVVGQLRAQPHLGHKFLSWGALCVGGWAVTERPNYWTCGGDCQFGMIEKSLAVAWRLCFPKNTLPFL